MSITHDGLSCLCLVRRFRSTVSNYIVI